MTRIERWVYASFATAQFEQFMVMVVQGLGRLDAALTKADKIFLADLEKNKTSLEESLKLNERFTLDQRQLKFPADDN